ncbi:NAD(P)H-binding protein [Nocardia alni]|uniref:NAD(P)H-binding protein n=1 Tax=Nocardia alni TaxID=2815723 RepID=UPI001C247556|nr:NAD(P)H-binding protein [Nocardia alni]
MILVTGATGTIGRDVVRRLVLRGDKVRALTRDPGAAIFPAGVDVVRGDYDDPASLDAAMAGVEAAFLVGVLEPGKPGGDAALVAAARAAGVRRVVKLSAIGTGDTTLGIFATWHMAGEQAVRDSTLAWTILRPSQFASNTLAWADAVRAGRPVPVRTGTGRQGTIDPRDIAEVAVRTLTSDDHAGRTYTLTGPAALSEPDLAFELASALQRPVALQELSSESVREVLRAQGRSEEFIDGALGGTEFIRDGGNVALTDDVRQVLGREPGAYARWVRDHLDAFIAD